MKISLKTIAPMIIGGVTLVSCSNVNDRLKDYISETGRSQAELEEIYNNCNYAFEKQSKLDSIAYRDIFNSTQAAKDSNKVAEFNKIAGKIRPQAFSSNNFDVLNSLCNNLIEEEIKVKDLEEIKERGYGINKRYINSLVHFADDWGYRTFFTKTGIMNDSIEEKCDEVSKKIRP